MKRLIAIEAVVLIVIFMPLIAQATGLGIYFPAYGNGKSTITVFDDEFENDVSHLGGGFLLDTKVADRGVFNYRLHLGFESVDYDYPENFSRFAIDNTFGFGIVKTRVLRLWLGPQIRLAYMAYDSGELGSGIGTYTYKINSLGFGLAPILGMNFNIGSVISICPEIGYRATAFVGTQRFENELIGSEDEDWDTTEREFFINLSILFRINDEFF